MERDINDPRSWLLLPPGGIAICRFPISPEVPEGCLMASASDLQAANLGRPFPWGNMPTPEKASRLWKEHRIGFGGLYHDQWFATTEGRFGGAHNVPEVLPGSLRSCFLYDGGLVNNPKDLAENEGWAVIREVDEVNLDLYRRVQMHAAEHVVADGGHIIVSPMDSQTGKVHVGFVGRCQICPNAELISFEHLKKAVPGYDFELLPEWKNWSLSPKLQATQATIPLTPTFEQT